MAMKEFSGKIKYLGDNSFCQVFKTAIVSVYAEKGNVYLKSRLACNPTRVFKCNEISGTETEIKGTRVIVRCIRKRECWEMHFAGEPRSANEKLMNEIQSVLKANSKAPQNKAEVGCGRKTSSAANGQRLFSVASTPKTNLEPPQQGHTSSKMTPETTAPGRLKPIHATVSGLLDGARRSRADENSGSPCFTRVKENKRQNGETRDCDDESKENQHRGPANQNVCDKQNKQGDRKPLQVSSFRFYGTSTQGKPSMDDAGSNNGFFKVTKSRPVSGPFFSPEGRKGQFSELMKTYSWNQNRKNTLSAAVKRETPQLQGFANIGNTCYMNAILQSLFGLDPFSVDLHFLCKLHSKALTRHSLAVALTKLMLMKHRPQNNAAHRVEELLHGVKRAISSTAKRFIGNQQHDAHEFLCQVLDQLKEEVIRVSKPKKETTAEETLGMLTPAESPDCKSTPMLGASGDPLPVSAVSHEAMTGRTPRLDQVVPAERSVVCSGGKALSPEQRGPADCAVKGSPPSSLLISPTFSNFEFEVVHSFQCINCQEQIQKAEQFNDLSVDIPKKTPGLTLSLQDALDIFFQKEEIDYRCEKCGHKKAEVTHKFAKLPRVLILHLKRYTYSSQWNNKVQEKLQLPRYITLQDHCDTSTVPHLPYRIMQITSPLKSPVLNSPLRQPTAVTPPDFRQRRRKIPQDENGGFRGHKKVRRSLLAEVHAEAPPSEKKPRMSLTQEDFGTKSKEDIEKSKPEVIMIDYEGDDADLQRAIDLSLEEYEANQKLSNHTSNEKDSSGSPGTNDDVPPWQSISATGGEASDEGKMDVLSLSYEKQLELAISRSLAPAESDADCFEDSAHQPELLNDLSPSADSGAFKKPVTALRKPNARKDVQTVAESSKSSDGACENNENGDLGMGRLGVRNFTLASDFMNSSDLRRSSPESGACVTGVRESRQTSPGSGDGEAGVFTSCRSLADTDEGNVPESVNASSVSISRSIGSVGALSKVWPRGGASDDDDDLGDDDGAVEDVKLRGEKDGEDGHCTPNNSPDKKQDSDSAVPSCVLDAWFPDEDVDLAEAFQDEWTEASDRSYVFDQEGKEGTEEKENMSPQAGGRTQNEGDVTETPVDKEVEAKQLQRKLRQTEIEKGILPHSYRLVSIVNHHGESSSCGHYVSDVFDIKKQAWFSFDDRKVDKTTEAYVRTKRTNTGYIFFYLSKDIFDDIETSRPGGSGKELIERP